MSERLEDEILVIGRYINPRTFLYIYLFHVHTISPPKSNLLLSLGLLSYLAIGPLLSLPEFREKLSLTFYQCC